MDSDHESDIHSHRPSDSAAMALDDLLGTNCTRIRLSATSCTLRPGPPDLDGLRKRALQDYQEWTRSQTEQTDAADRGRVAGP
jgi:hypothetical protein